MQLFVAISDVGMRGIALYAVEVTNDQGPSSSRKEALRAHSSSMVSVPAVQKDMKASPSPACPPVRPPPSDYLISTSDRSSAGPSAVQWGILLSFSTNLCSDTRLIAHSSYTKAHLLASD